MVTLISNSSAETEHLGEEWGRVARIGDVIALSGDLGTGKTQLVKGLARGLGYTGRVHSPTFSLINIYENGRLPLFHLDLYRLDNPQQILAAGLDPYLAPREGVAVVEWAERWFGSNPGEWISPTGILRRVVLLAPSESSRQIDYEDIGA